MPVELKRVAHAELPAKQPFNFATTASVYNFGWYFDGSTLLMPLRSEKLVVAVVRGLGESVAVELFSTGPIDEDWALKRVSYSLGLEEDLSSFWRVASRDRILAMASKALSGMRLRSADLWTAFIVAVCQQNASFRQGWAMVGNILTLLGRRVVVAGKETVIPPSPLEVLQGSAIALKKARTGYRAAAIIAGAKLFVDVGEEELSRFKTGELEETLCSLKGVGPYTARVAALFGLRRYEVNPVDRWLARVMSTAYGVDIVSLGEAEKLWASKWGRWAGLAAFFTTIVTDALPASKAVERVRKGELLPNSDLPRPTPATLWKWTQLTSRSRGGQYRRR